VFKPAPDARVEGYGVPSVEEAVIVPGSPNAVLSPREPGAGLENAKLGVWGFGLRVYERVQRNPRLVFNFPAARPHHTTMPW